MHGGRLLNSPEGEKEKDREKKKQGKGKDREEKKARGHGGREPGPFVRPMDGSPAPVRFRILAPMDFARRQTMPCAIMALATFMKPAMLAPLT